MEWRTQTSITAETAAETGLSPKYLRPAEKCPYVLIVLPSDFIFIFSVMKLKLFPAVCLRVLLSLWGHSVKFRFYNNSTRVGPGPKCVSGPKRSQVPVTDSPQRETYVHGLIWSLQHVSVCPHLTPPNTLINTTPSAIYPSSISPSGSTQIWAVTETWKLH